jgi:hypothetical protein
LIAKQAASAPLSASSKFRFSSQGCNYESRLGTTDLGIVRLKDRKRAETQGFFGVIVPYSMTGRLEKVD